MRRLATATVLVALAACTWASGAAAQPRFELAPTGQTAFPGRLFALTLPSGVSVDPKGIRVTENGRAVADLEATPVRASQKSGTVLVIDASDSMRGEAIKDAVAAARVFARERNPDQRLGVIAFGSTVTPLAPLTSEPGPIASALAGPPPLRPGTHMYDAVSAAISMLEDQGVTTGSVMVLSDGADTGSRTSFDQLVSRARASGTRIFTVGLRSRTFDITALERLAAGAHGEYSEAGSPKELAQIYEQLGSRLAHEILIRYRSVSDRGSRVLVGVSVAGQDGSATSEYVAPRLRTRGEHPSSGTGFWGSTVVMVAVSLLAGVLLAIAAAMLLVLRRRRALRARVEGFVSLPEGVDARAWGSALATSLLERTEKSLERARRWAALKEELEVARVPTPAVQVVLGAVAGTVLCFMLLYLWSGRLALGVPALCIPFAVQLAIRHRARKQRRTFGDQLADNLQVIASAMRAGHSLSGALAVAADDAAEPARTELRRVVADERLGVALEDALTVTMRRMQNTDLEQVVLVAVVQHETGGNTAEVVDRVAANIRERAELRRMIDTLTAQGRLSRWVVSSLPVILLALITALNPAYIAPLYDTGVGRAMLALAAALVMAGSFAIKRVVSIKV
jgi:tight adherence protein B